MKKESYKKHLQKFCDISNYARMHMHPRKGKRLYDEAKAQAKEVLRLLFTDIPNESSTAVAIAALTLARSYVNNAQAFGIGFIDKASTDIMSQYEKLFSGDWWMNLNDDMIQTELESFMRGEYYPWDYLGIFSYRKESMQGESGQYNVYRATLKCMKRVDEIVHYYDLVKKYEDAVWQIAFFLNSHMRFTASLQEELPELLVLAWYYANKEFGCPFEDSEFESFMEALRVDVYKELTKRIEGFVGVREWYRKQSKK